MNATTRKVAIDADKAGPVIQALETVEERVKASMARELATKRDLKNWKSL